nr:endonuclease-reverse transcriptase HmRTE-e01 [Haemonchus contortus]
MYNGFATATRTPYGQTGATDVTFGVRQESALSPFLFLLTMDVITEGLMDGPLKTIMYADDIALIAEGKAPEMAQGVDGEWTPYEREEE